MLTYDTVARLDSIAETLPTYEERFAMTRLATTVSTVVSAREAMQRALDVFGNAENNTYGAGYADGATLAADMIKVVEDALAAYVTLQVKP